MNGRSRTASLDNTKSADLPRETVRQDALTKREREILSLIAQGQANKEIAEQLAISVRTVEAHRAKIMRKLSIHSHASLIYYAMRWNIADLP